MKKIKTSRILNNESYFLGLSHLDISGSGVLLFSLLLLAKAMGIQSVLWTLICTLTFLMALVPVRLHFRRHILRDSLFYLLNHGVIYVTKNRRKP